MLKKLFVFLFIGLLSIGLISCDSNDDVLEIGILQYLEHNALSAARDGFIDGLAEAGYVNGENIKIKILNPETDQNTMGLQAKELVRRSDLILAIATPAAHAVVNEAKEQGKKTPILFTAVTDPVSSKLIASNEKPGGNVTGTNDLNPISEQIALAKELLPNANKLGILYTSSERNSEIQANLAKVEAEKLGFTVTIKTISTVNDLQQVANSLARDVDIIYIPTDNPIAGSIGVLSNVLKTNKVPAIVGEDNLVPFVPSLTTGINYYKLGQETAKMAVKILKDKVSPKDIPSVGLDKFELVINEKRLGEIGIEIPKSLLDRADKVIN